MAVQMKCGIVRADVRGHADELSERAGGGTVEMRPHAGGIREEPELTATKPPGSSLPQRSQDDYGQCFSNEEDQWSNEQENPSQKKFINVAHILLFLHQRFSQHTRRHLSLVVLLRR